MYINADGWINNTASLQIALERRDVNVAHDKRTEHSV